MHSSIMGISSIYGREEEVTLQDRLQFIFILRKELITNEDIRMITMMYYSKHELKRYGFNAEDYFIIKDKIQEAAIKQGRMVRIILVTDALNCQDILLNSSQGKNSSSNKSALQMQGKNRALKNVERIFIFSQNEDHKHYNFEDYKNIVVKCIPIRSYINGAIKILKDSKQNPYLFRSMIFLGDKRQERLSYLVKVWVKAWLSIKPSQYQNYLRKYLEYLLQLYGKQDDSTFRFQQSQISLIRQILSLMEKKCKKQYSKLALQLYQHQIIFFYRSLNMGVKKYIEDINYSEGIAIPFKMIFLSIKNQFNDLFSKRQQKNNFGEKFTKNGIERLFKDEDYIVLWRWAKIGGQQIKNIKKMSENGNYIEFINFTSTSRSKKVACTFFSSKDIEGDCLIKIILKRPQLKEELQKFPFIYLSFAYLQDIKQNKEYQILFNALTVAKVIKLSKITYSSLQIKHESLKKNQQLYLIELQIGSFYELLTEYSNNPNNQIFTQSQRAILQNYLITLEALNEKQYDIGRAYELSGHQTKAYDFYNKKLQKIKKESKLKRQKQKEHKQKMNVLAKKSYEEDLKINQSIQQNNILNLQKRQQDSKQLQRKNSSVEIDQDAIQDIILLQDIDEVKNYQFLHNKLALICSKMGKQKEAIENSAISMKLYDTLRQTDKSLSIKEHQQMKNKLLLQHVQILEDNGLYLQVNQFIKNRIKQLELSAQQQSENSLLFHFIIAEVSIIKGLVNISRGCYTAAKANFILSKQKTDHIKKEIKYESLQTETFYFQFLIDLIIFRSVTFRHKNQYFRHQRAKKIDQATKIFGGRIKFENVANNSQQLIKNIEQIDQNQKKKQENSKEKLDYDLMVKIEESAVGKAIKKMQPSFKIFLNELDDKVNQQDGADGHDSLSLERKMHLCFLELDDHENIGKVESQFDQLEAKVVQKRLKNWKIQRIHQTSLKDTILKIKKMVIQMKDVYKQMKVDKGNILLDYQISIKKDIERYLSNSKKWGYTEPLMDEVKQCLKLIKINYQIGKKESAKKQLKELFLDIRKIDNFRLQTLEGYILNINIIFQGAEMDYLNIFISKKSTQIIKSEIINKSARQLKDHKLIDCLNTIEKALKFIKKLSNQSDILLMQQQNIQVQASLRDPIIKSLNSIKKEVKQQNREINRNRRDLRSNKVAQSKYHIQIMRVKCKIQLKMQIKQIQFSFNKIQKIRHVTQNQIHISTIRQQALGLLEYYKNQQKRSFDLLSQCFNKMKGNRLIDIKHKAILLTKIFFLLPKHTQQNANPLKIDLQIYQSQLMPYHFYWRILLAQYISKISNRRGQGHYYIKKCKHFIENYCTEDDESKIRKSLIISEYEASREKQKLTVSATSFSRKYSMIKPPQKFHLSLQQADKISFQSQKQYQNQFAKIAQQKILVQNPEEFYQKPKIQSLQNIRTYQENKFSEQLRQKSIQSDNLNNEQDDFQEVQFPFPNISQQLLANLQQNRQEGLSKKYRSDELKRENNNKNNNVLGQFSKRIIDPQKRLCELRQSKRMIMSRQLSLKRSSSNNSSYSNYSSPQKSTNQNTSPYSRFSKSPIMIEYLLSSKRRFSPTKNFMNQKKEIILASNSFESTISWMSMARLKRQNSREQLKNKLLESNQRRQKKTIYQNSQISNNDLLQGQNEG